MTTTDAATDSNLSDVQDAPESPAPEEKISPRGISAMQGNDQTPTEQPPDTTEAEEQPTDIEATPAQQPTDATGRNLSLRTFQEDDQYYLRVFDREKTPGVAERLSFGDAGRANLRLERGTNEQVERARLQDIDVTPGYRQSGVGSWLLKECETIARNNCANEIYGTAPSDDITRDWYTHRGYQFRDEGREVFKDFD